MKRRPAPSAPTPTTVGAVAPDVLAYTAGRDVELDRALVESDCIGTAAHVTMLARMPVTPPVIRPAEARRVVRALVDLLREARAGRFEITLADQDVHLAVERALTARLGDLGKRVHTARSRNDQVAVDLRLHAKGQLLETIEEAAALAGVLIELGARQALTPMVGRTHMQKAMPSSVGLWSTAHAESLLDDTVTLRAAGELNDRCPLGSAAGYGVPLPIDRQLVSDLLGFAGPVHNVLYAGNARGKNESVILSALAQVMLTLSRLAQDLILFSLPEFGYFRFPAALGTGSSIMPQKNNPDVLELVRARAAAVLAGTLQVQEIVKASPSGYNRDLQETKEPFLNGLATTRASLRIMVPFIRDIEVDAKALAAAFSPEVFAADRALELVGRGMPFRDAYREVKEHLDELGGRDPAAAVAAKSHLGAPAGLDFDHLRGRVAEAQAYAADRRRAYHAAVSRLLGVRYPMKPGGRS